MERDRTTYTACLLDDLLDAGQFTTTEPVQHEGTDLRVGSKVVGAEDHTYLSDENLPVWKVVTE